MLLPSALPCDGARRHSPRLFSSPPPSDDESPALPPTAGLFRTCRALQSMLSPPPQSQPKKALIRHNAPDRLTPPLLSAGTLVDAPKFKVRKSSRIAKVPQRGKNKRRRGEEDDGHSEEDMDQPRTPKRPRAAPSILPLGLSQSDFEALDREAGRASSDQLVEQTADAKEGDSALESIEKSEGSVQHPDAWSQEDDRVLVEMVLEKLKLSRSDWEECARSLGKDRSTIGRRWKTLMSEGSIGLKGRRRVGKQRGKLEGMRWSTP